MLYIAQEIEKGQAIRAAKFASAPQAQKTLLACAGV
jgi:hypothetical protein